MKSRSEQHDENVEVVESSASASIRDAAESETAGWDQKSTARLLRKLDWNIIPFMSLIYLCASPRRC